MALIFADNFVFFIVYKSSENSNPTRTSIQSKASKTTWYNSSFLLLSMPFGLTAQG